MYGDNAKCLNKEKVKLMKSEDYEVSGTTLLTDCNGPKISRISKQKLYPKLFDGINIHVCGSNGWNQFTLINYNMNHLKAFHISWSTEVVQKYNIIYYNGFLYLII
ncbi:uncharacterized protein LOC103310799 [Acyrthosiphon pisum]|uniref:Uncharacterized protein n=1 Tax=Acyrthosiphon pisum TaxID=7029 RepID=A0A8R2BAA3_ACYPI|nr:uncharacterized protein LOC103310799 [Acyrthosiphon pisum]|eukprot:XP_008188342.1 PREDICTED: uncharacterized protein LOC103310799 [Acyrthosiphon pisum]